MVVIKHKITGAALFTSTAAVTLRDAVTEAVESGASLDGASLNRASLNRASLNRASLYGASLDGARGIYSFGPIGAEKRLGYAVKHDGGAYVKLGCFWGTQEAALAAIAKKYGEGALYAEQVALACKIVMGDAGNVQT